MINIYVAFIVIFFILAFAARNFITWRNTGKSIRGASSRVTASIVLSVMIYAIVLGRIFFIKPQWVFEFDLSSFPWIKYTGLFLITTGFITGVVALIAMKDSWRVGIKHDQKTTLVTRGIYRFSRNPYFLSYNLLIPGLVLIFPSIILAAFYIALAIVFHSMILEEEKYLLSVHGTDYQNYKDQVNRYITFK